MYGYACWHGTPVPRTRYPVSVLSTRYRYLGTVQSVAHGRRRTAGCCRRLRGLGEARRTAEVRWNRTDAHEKGRVNPVINEPAFRIG